MATIHPGDPVSLYPGTDILAAGLPLIIPKLDCKNLGAMTTSGTFKGFPPRVADRDNVIGAMDGLVVPDPFKANQWGKAGFPMIAQLQRQTCLWLNHASVKVTATLDLIESRSPVDFVNAPQANIDIFWEANTTISRTLVSGTPPSDFSYLNGGQPWDVDVFVEAVDAGCDVAIHAVATFHTPSGFALSGTPEVQERRQGCDEFHTGTGMTFFWTGVHFNPGDPVGLVKSLSLTLRGSSVFM